MKKIIMILMMLLLLLCSCGYNENGKDGDVFKKVNNEQNINELITKKVKIDSTSDFGTMTIDEIDKKFDIECLRKVDDIYYAVFKTREYGLLYLVFSNEDQGDNYYVVSYYFPEYSPNSNDFDTLKINESTMTDVQKIDPFGLYLTGFGRVDVDDYSCHMTSDGYSIFVYYQKGESIVIDITKTTNEYFIGNYLLSIDK